MNYPSLDLCEGLTDHQREQLALAIAGPLGILAGRPGTGKTFCLADLLKAMQGYRVCVAGPTGKCCVRVTESLAKAGVSGMIARTIHSTLGVASADDGWSFNHDADNPLPYDFIFVDEASMIDVSLMGSLLVAVKPGAKILFVGDIGQLLPVSHGAPLRDLTAYGIPCGKLTEPMRQAADSQIVRACHAIADKAIYQPILDQKLIDIDTGDNLLHIERGSPQTQIAELMTMLDRIRNGPAKKFDVFDDVQILVPVNDKSLLGRKPLNKVLQGFLNPAGEQVSGNPFRKNDKIINTANGLVPVERDSELIGKYEALAEEECNVDENDGKIYCANGEQGRVVQPFPTYTVAVLRNPLRLVRIPKGKSFDGENGKKCDTGCAWELAYAISTHKSQGSEWPVVIVMLDSYSGAVRLCTKEWLYTALSRGKTFVITIGRKSLADAMCKRSGLWIRKTFLKESIDELAGQNFVHEIRK